VDPFRFTYIPGYFFLQPMHGCRRVHTVKFGILFLTVLRPGESVLNTKEILDHINGEISRLQQVKALLQGATNGHSKASVKGSSVPKVKGKRVLSPEARKKIAAAQRRRWAKARKASV
jgi:hypothetical protein